MTRQAAAINGTGPCPGTSLPPSGARADLSPAGRPNGPSAQRLTTRPAPLPTLWHLPHTINSPIPPKNLTRDMAAMPLAVRISPIRQSRLAWGSRAAGRVGSPLR